MVYWKKMFAILYMINYIFNAVGDRKLFIVEYKIHKIDLFIYRYTKKGFSYSTFCL